MVGDGEVLDQRPLGNGALPADRQEQDHLRGAFEDARVPMVLTSMERDRAGRFLRVNSAFCELTGYTREELAQRSFQLLTHPDDLDQSVETLRRMMAGEFDSCQMEKRYLRRDGSTIWAQVDISIVDDGPGTTPYCVAQIQDITERRLEQAALREAERELHQAFEQGPIGLCLIEVDGGRLGRFVRANAAFYEMSGYRPDQLSGMEALQLASDEQRTQIAAQITQLVAGEITKIDAEYQLVDSEGRMHWVAVAASLVSGEDGRPRFLIAQLQDIDERKHVQLRLIRTISLHEATADSTADGLLVVDNAGTITSYNQQFIEMWRVPESIVESRDDDQAVAFVLDQLADPDGFVAKVKELYDSPMAESFDVLDFKDGRIFERYSKPQLIEGEPVGRVWSFRDVTARRTVEQELRDAESKYRSLVEKLPGITYLVDDSGPESEWLYVSPQIESMLGYTAEEWKADPTLWLRSVHPDDREAAIAADVESRESGRFSLDYRMFTREGELIWFHDVGARVGRPDGKLSQGFMLDITERKRSEQRVSYLAYHDGLTGLPNRAMFQDHLDLAVARARRHGRAVAVLYMDLDRFKLINDSFGHASGDELLRQIAGRLQVVTRADDLVARHSGDEFLVMLADIEPDADGSGSVSRASEIVAAKIHEALRAPFVIEDEEVYVDGSVGISLFPTDASGAEELMRHADMAMYESKRLGQGGTQVYARAVTKDPAAQLSLASRLRRATERGEFVLLYQPIVNLARNEMIGAEALIRWCDPERGAVLPKEFVPLAEETGLIEQIGEWVIEEVCRQSAAWQREGLDLEVGFNLSLRQLRRPDLAKRLIQVAGAAGADPTKLVAEITESAVMRDPEQAKEAVEALHACGTRTAIDDFGTGHSSLSRLMHVPVHILKIDRTFVSVAPHDRSAAAMIAGIVQIANGMRLTPVAEGIETEEQRKFLVGVGCTMGQGFHFSRPVPAEEISFMGRRQTLGSTKARPGAPKGARRLARAAAAASKRLH